MHKIIILNNNSYYLELIFITENLVSFQKYESSNNFSLTTKFKRYFMNYIQIKNFLYSIIFVFLIFTNVESGEISIEEAEKAYSDGKIDIALDIWQKLSLKGDVIALNNLGYLYEKGIGVKKDLLKSLELYLKSANAGAPIAQYNVGEIYAEGRGVSINNKEALKWFIIAGLRGDRDAMNYSEKLATKMNDKDIIEATNYAKAWRPDFKGLLKK